MQETKRKENDDEMKRRRTNARGLSPPSLAAETQVRRHRAIRVVAAPQCALEIETGAAIIGASREESQTIAYHLSPDPSSIYLSPN